MKHGIEKEDIEKKTKIKEKKGKEDISNSMEAQLNRGRKVHILA